MTTPRRVLTPLFALLLGLGLGLTPAAQAAPPPSGRAPLAMDSYPDIYQRVLTLPGAALYAAAGDATPAQANLPVFSIFYVFGRKMVGETSWLEVSPTVNGDKLRWVPAAKTQDWHIMLVMQYAPPGQRKPTLFFKSRDDLATLVRDPRVSEKARALHDQVLANTHDGRLVTAVEEGRTDRGAVSFNARPYLMPILGFRRDQFDNDQFTTLVQTASVNAQTTPAPPARTDLAAFKLGIVFVVDTTKSMGPYIERVTQTLGKVYDQLKRDRLLDKTTFGIVAYRNNMDGRPGLEYVTKTVQPLDPRAAPETVLENLRAVKEARTPTHSWDEDGIAGLTVAINDMDWRPYSARFIIHVSDSGMITDDKARFPKRTPLNVREAADRQNISIIPVHLLTPESERANDVPTAREQYKELGRTGNHNINKYVAIPAGSPDVFATQLNGFVGSLGQSIGRLARGESENRPPEPSERDDPNRLGQLFFNELFTMQQRYIGERRGAEAPRFYSAWASDYDLANPRQRSLDVKVFLTRNQLNQLAQSLSRIVDAAKRSLISDEGFFDQLRGLAAATAVDPERIPSRMTSIGDANLLPPMLRLLPYRSDVLDMTIEKWRERGFTGQQQFIGRLESKLQVYADINADTGAWVNLGAGDPGLQVYPIPLEYLP